VIIYFIEASMRYPMPNFPCYFELPDAWIAEAGLDRFTPATGYYRSTADAVPVPLATIEPVYRLVTHPKDWCGFDRVRLISVLKGIVSSAEIEPVPLLALPVTEFPPAPYRYRVLDGFHRFYASIAAGFECLPGIIG
jgi:hypothetical protein